MSDLKLKSGAVYGVSCYDGYRKDGLMSKVYYCRIRIGNCEYESKSYCNIKALYKIACSMARFGKRNHVKVRFIVRDTLGNTIIRTYARYSESKREWIARHSSGCRYAGYNGMGRYL